MTDLSNPHGWHTACSDHVHSEAFFLSSFLFRGLGLGRHPLLEMLLQFPAHLPRSWLVSRGGRERAGQFFVTILQP